MAVLQEVRVDARPLERFREVIGDERTERFIAVAAAAAQRLEGRTVWNVNSTASGGGVAEMLSVLLTYVRGAGVDTRWLVIEGDAPFFAVTKRLHNHLHGSAGDGGALGPDEHATYDRITAANAAAMRDVLRPGDVVLLHDPQTAGLAATVADCGAHPVWRCHIGPADRDGLVDGAEAFLAPYLQPCEAFVFSRDAHVHPWMRDRDVYIIPPSIDPFSPKNQELTAGAARAIVAAVGLLPDGGPDAVFLRRDGSPTHVVRTADIARGGPLPDDVPLVVQVSRWDRLKDMAGVMHGFAAHVAAPAHLALVGPSVAGVTDDPEGAEVLAECVAVWDALPADVRERVHLVTLPLDDPDENAAMVNAIQRYAAIVVQKSLQEGFGLTVTEAMLKSRPVVASRVGGIADQIVDGEHGLLVDPTDLDAFGEAVAGLLADPDRARRLGDAAQARVLDRFVGDRHLTQYAELMAGLLAREG
jgi:trehalose synthase